MRRFLLTCGILSSLVYLVTDVAGALSWESYRYAAQSISELSAIGAPSRPVVVPLWLLYNLLLIGFGFGVRAEAPGRSYLAATGVALIATGVLGLIAAFFPMHVRGMGMTVTDAMHIALTATIVICILMAIGSAAISAGSAFRLYSIATLLAMLVFGTFAALDGPRIAANLPTPMLGVTERINVGAYLLWVALLALRLLCRPAEVSSACAFLADRRTGS